MTRSLILAAAVALLAGCQPNRPAAPAPVETVKRSDMIVGLWTVTSSGYKHGVYQDREKILTACTEYKADGTYESTSQFVNPNYNFVDTELGTWSYNGSFLTMIVTKSTRKMIKGKFDNPEPSVGKKFEIEIIELTPTTMLRRTGTDEFQFIKSDKPRIYTEKDLAAPAKKTNA